MKKPSIQTKPQNPTNQRNKKLEKLLEEQKSYTPFIPHP